MAKRDRDTEYDAWLARLTMAELEARLQLLGVSKVVMKRLADSQDNSQNQFYWQSNLNENPLPMGHFVDFKSRSKKTGQEEIGFKAALDLEWLTPSGTNPAPHAQLIYYPQYPETRLGSLLAGAHYAPRSLIASRDVAVPDRLMLLGAAGTKIVGVVLPPGSPAARALINLFGSRPFATWAIVPQTTSITADELLAELHGVYRLGAVAGCTVKGNIVVPSSASNAAGTTLETLLGVKPNSRDEPDFHGWELKAHSDSRVTLMTPAPTGGAITTLDPEAFMRAFGRKNDTGSRWDFNGAHRAGLPPGGKATTKLAITKTEVRLVHKTQGTVAMSWRIADLLTKWSRKHSRAAYVRRTGSIAHGMTFGPHVQLGEGVDWVWFRQALDNGTIALDPAYNMRVGRRSMDRESAQFRCYSYELGALYPVVTLRDLRHSPTSRRLAHANLRTEGITLPSHVEQ